MTNTSEVQVDPTKSAMKKKKTKGRFKRIRGLLTGESRRERKARKAAERAASGKTALEKAPSGDEEEASVYGIDIDDMSTAESRTYSAPSPERASLLGGHQTNEDGVEDDELPFLTPNQPKRAPALQVVLLLIDPVSHRFELLQLEFDSNKTLVSDILAQIPQSVAEETLRKQQYHGVCDTSGIEMIKTVRLSEFCQTNEVILAIPLGISSKECARLARPILSDDGVIAMLRARGIDAQPIPISPTEDREVAGKKEEAHGVSSKSTIEWVLIVAVVIVVLLQAAQTHITSPLKPGQVLKPGTWMSKCGLLSVFPIDICENSGLEMNQEGVLTLYGHDGSVQWRLVGGSCMPDTNCVPGLMVKDDGNLVIGDKHITSVTIKGDAPLTPWPFEKEPKLRVVRQ